MVRPIKITAKNQKDRKLAKQLSILLKESPEMQDAAWLLSTLISTADTLEMVYGVKINLSVDKTNA